MIAGAEEQEFWAALEAIYAGAFLPHAVVAPATPEQAASPWPAGCPCSPIAPPATTG